MDVAREGEMRGSRIKVNFVHISAEEEAGEQIRFKLVHENVRNERTEG